MTSEWVFTRNRGKKGHTVYFNENKPDMFEMQYRPFNCYHIAINLEGTYL